MKQQIRNYRIPLLASLALGVLPLLYLLNGGVRLNQLNPRDHVVQNLLTYFLLILFSYYNHTVYVPNLYLTRRYSRYGAVVLIWILVVALVPHRVEQWVFLKPPGESTPMEWMAQLFWRENLFYPAPQEAPGNGPPDRPGDRPRPPRNEGPPPQRNDLPDPPEPGDPSLPIKFGIIFLLCSVSALVSISVQTASRLQQLEVDKLQAELGQLKAQIHPHFLFNTLNSIYALALRKDDKTADIVVKLAEFMRYMTREAGNNWVPLAKELAYIQNYLDLQQTRLRKSVRVSYTTEGSANGHQIAPLILFTFIENAFKHGVNPDEDSQIRISIRIHEHALALMVYNRKVTIRSVETDGGMGISNTQARLQLLYPKQHQLIIEDTPESYTITLVLSQL